MKACERVHNESGEADVRLATVRVPDGGRSKRAMRGVRERSAYLDSSLPRTGAKTRGSIARVADAGFRISDGSPLEMGKLVIKLEWLQARVAVGVSR